MKNKFLLSAGFVNLFVAILHLIGGQITLVNPLLDSTLIAQVKAEWLGAWHMVTIVLFYTSFVFIRYGIGKTPTPNELIKFLGWLYVFFGIPSLVSSVYFGVFAAQFILLLPIGVLGLISVRQRAQ